MDKPEIKVCRSADEVAHAAAEIFVEEFKLAVARSGKFIAVLSGGHTPVKTYDLLTREPYVSKINWSQVHIFFGDERCVPSTDPRSNYWVANNTFLSRVPIPSAQIHPMFSGVSQRGTASDYEEMLKFFFSPGLPMFDLVFLGLGEDGHTASLFPESKAQFEKTKWVVTTRKANENFARMSLTAWVLSLTHLAVFLVTGKEKSETLKKVLQSQDDNLEKAPDLPALLVRPIKGRLLWLTDSLSS